MSEIQSIKFHASGMHCHSCEVLIEDNLKEAEGVKDVQASLAHTEVTVSGNFNETPEELAKIFSARIQEHGYTLSAEKKKQEIQWAEFLYALPAALIFIVGFLALQKSGVLNFSFSSKVGYGTAFFIGLIASVSTCLAVVGGLVLSVSAHAASRGDAWKPQLLFHVGRLLSFFVLGGIIGLLGSAFQLGITGNLILSLVVACVMLILGVNLLNVFHVTKKLQIVMPKIFSELVLKLQKSTHWVTPFLVGIATFFLPCGFTQSMQVYSLTTGNFLTGGLTMVSFALGTLPVLALLSFGAFSIAHKSWKGTFFKAAGIVVIALAVFNMLNALAAAGIINPVVNL
jgi:sulfite exporter TauE/SafE/copper chaperone CopZ